MLQLFRTNQPYIIALLLLYAVLLRLHHFLIPTIFEPQAEGFMSRLIYDGIGTSGLSANILSIALVLLQAVLLNGTVNRHKMQAQATYFPALAYVLIVSALPDFLDLQPLHFANTFFILGINQLFASYRKPNAVGELFNLGFFVAAGSLFYFSMNILLLFAVLGLTVVRSFNIRELLVLLFGFAVPYFWLGTYLFWNDRFYEFHSVWAAAALFDIKIIWSGNSYVGLALFVLFGVLSLANFRGFFYKTNIQVQKYITMLYWALFIAALSFVYQPHLTLSHLLMFAPSLGIFMGFFLQNIKNRPIAEVFHTALLIIILILHYVKF
jgi:hypothetical protein